METDPPPVVDFTSPHLNLARVADRVREIGLLSPEVLAVRMRRACAHEGASIADLARHEVSHEQMLELWQCDAESGSP